MKKLNIIITLIALVFLYVIYVKCKENSENHIPAISDDYKIQAISTILKDTLHLNILPTGKMLVSNYSLLPPPSLKYYDSIENDFKEQQNFIEFVSDILDVDDTLYIKKQILSNRKLDLNQLSEYGYEILDVKKYLRDNVSLDSIDRIVDKYNKDNNLEIADYIIVSKPLFNKNKNLLYLRISNLNQGISGIFSMQKGHWKLIREVENWTE
ncbi:hypothetical protein [Zunongwangia sp.]|uniref:hypothetical protein n=1 Tax=Zunongwangia sp. TaxID=1965325 RepID=UPI003AA894B0